MFCKYCGKEIKEGEICTCRQQGSKTPYPKPDIRPVMPERENTQRQGINQNQGNSQNQGTTQNRRQQTQFERKPVNRTPVNKTSTAPQNQRNAKKDGKGLAVASFLLSFLLLVSFVLLRVVLQDFMQESTMLESIYPYLIYVVPFLLGLGAFLCAIFSLQDARVRTLSISGILISAIFVAGIFVSKVLFPYEADSYVASSDRSDEEDEEEVGKDNSKDTEDASKEEETAESDSSISQIKSDYQKGTLDYAGVKNALAKLDTDKLESKEAEEVLALQEQTEKDLEDSLEKSAKSSDYESILKQLSKQKEELKDEDELITKLSEKYEPEYILYLDTESKNLLAQGKKDDALKLLKNGKTLVEDTDAVDNLIAEAEEGVTGGDYILPESNSRYLTDADVSGLTLQQLNYAKNEIYARHGRKFDSKELQNYFGSKSWYNGTVNAADFKETVFNEYEKKNAEFLRQKEFAMHDGGYQLDQ
ncbi:YARHG domain-containing protein [Blautia stercoris]